MSTQNSQLAVQAKVDTSNMPTAPTPSAAEYVATFAGLAEKRLQVKAARDGLFNTYTIGGTKATAYDFLLGATAKPIPPRPLDQPDQFSIGWTNYADVYK